MKEIYGYLGQGAGSAMMGSSPNLLAPMLLTRASGKSIIPATISGISFNGNY